MRLSGRQAFLKGVAAAMASFFLTVFIAQWAASIGLGEAAASAVGGTCGILGALIFVALFHWKWAERGSSRQADQQGRKE